MSRTDSERVKEIETMITNWPQLGTMDNVLVSRIREIVNENDAGDMRSRAVASGVFNQAQAYRSVIVGSHCIAYPNAERSILVGNSLQTHSPNVVLIGNGEVNITLHERGTVEYGKQYHPSEAADAFWTTLSKLRR